MPDLVALVEQLRNDLEVLTEGVCELDRVTVTAGEPAAGVGGCNSIWVWADRLEPRRFDDACMVQTEATIRYRLDVCYSENDDGSDQTDAQHEASADCLGGLMEAAWCGLVDLVGSDHYGPCKDVRLLPLELQPRQGMVVSARGGVTFAHDC